MPAFLSEWYGDARFVKDMYNCSKWSMEHWIAVAASTGGWYSHDMYSDFGNTDTPPDLYRLTKTQYFYVVALQHMASFANRVGNAADFSRFAALAASTKADFMKRLFNTSSGCFGNCTYVSQIFGLQLLDDANSFPKQAAAWESVLSHIGPNATNLDNANRFGGGIVSLKLVYPLFQRFGESALALKTLLRPHSPSLGYMTMNGGTTLHEAWSMAGAYEGTWVGSFNHIMMSSPGKWFYTLFAGIDRASVPGGQHASWSRLQIEPPRDPAVWAQNLTSCRGALATPAGNVTVEWTLHPEPHILYTLNVEVPVTSRATVVVPTVLQSGSVTIEEGAAVVWAKGICNTSTTAGISTCMGGRDLASVEFELGSGSYAFVVSN